MSNFANFGRARAWILACAAAFPVALWSNRDGADPFKTGGPFPGESICLECHNQPSPLGPFPNRGPGKVDFSVSNYRPGEKQIITISVSDPTTSQQRWGFEITARPANALTTGAGSFRAVDGNAQVICNTGAAPPCAGGTPQFATHTLVGTRPRTTGGVSFQVEWTAPDSNVGDIIFAAAGNAANNSNTPDGDIIYTKTVRISPATESGPPPTISAGGIVGAGLSTPRVTQLSPNAIISLFGQNFAPTSTAQSAALVDGKLPTDIGGVCVQFGTAQGRMFFLSSGQINVQVPALADRGPVSVQVITNCGQSEVKSDPVSVPMQAVSPEFFFFKFNADGKNPIAALDALTAARIGTPDLVPGVAFTPAKPNEFLTLFMTGLGATDPAFDAGVLPDKAAATVQKASVSVNGVTLPDGDVLYAGVAPGFAGLYQVNIKVPANAPDGDLPVVVTIGGVSTPAGAFITVKK